MCRSKGVGTGGPDHPSRMEKHKAVDFLRNTGLEPLKKYKATDVGSPSDTSEAPLK